MAFFDLNEIVQRRIAADPTGKPAPLAIGDFQTVMLTGAVGVAPETHQLLRLISPQIGQQIHLTDLRYHLQWDIWHMFHLRSGIKKPRGFQDENLSAMYATVHDYISFMLSKEWYRVSSNSLTSKV